MMGQQRPHAGPVRKEHTTRVGKCIDCSGLTEGEEPKGPLGRMRIAEVP